MNTNKPTFVISAPVDTYSGYGARARDVVKAIYNLNKFNVQVMPQRWGATSWGYIADHAKDWGFLNEIMLPFQQPLTAQPDYWMQITIPNEFQAIGKINIGVTAGIETTMCHPSWIEGLNRMTETWVSSVHAKQVFENTIAQEKNAAGQIVRTIKMEKPMHVVLEGANLDVYKATSHLEPVAGDILNDIMAIPESFAFLFAGSWIQGAFGEDRKNIPFLIKAFLETFKDTRNAPALILKTQITTHSTINTEEVLKRIHEIKKTVKAQLLPNVYVMMGDVSDDEMNQLYNHPKVKAMVSLTKGEGFGRPLLEFSLTGKPVIASGWSGHLDFLHRDHTFLVGGQLKPIHPSAMVENILIQDSHWFAPAEDQVAKTFKYVYTEYKKCLVKAKQQKHFAKTNFAFANMQTLIDKLLTKLDAAQPKLVELQLPKLQKIS